ncbi:MAG: class I SAM-dependent methyltransferase [Gammaproteobacteria bacterium]|nr:class I SAM-dependent methyltransferase [Gammaproteobacteria bacterium]MBV8307306.1 class I SAM-dependent methyltransferase [Gammaproteobacteria bacterium]
MRRTAIAALAGLLTVLAAPFAAAAPSIPAYISAAVADSARPAEDKQRDADRKPAETLAFAGVKPGDTVIELAPGKGYYTRLLSAVVGPKGKVYAVSSQPKPDAPPPPIQALAADPHYSNVTVSLQHIPELAAPASAVDLVWTTQNYHDLHNIEGVDPAKINRVFFGALKPGGTYLVLDHAAEAGSGTRDTNTLHRIDEQTVKQEVTAAGFQLAAESDILRNKADAHTAKVFDPEIRGHTDQFLLKFKKP